jgi:hypothetical protein
MTQRQRVLLDRLLTLGTWLSDGKLPVQVTEVYGFGSFFRGKAQPRDVDLVLRCLLEDTADFQLFSTLLDKATYGGFSSDFSTPQAALLHVFDQHYSSLLPGVINVTAQRRLFEEWIEGYTWGMLFDTTFHRQLTLRSATEIARRLIKRHLPNLNVPMWLSPDRPIDKCGLNAGFAILVWSREKPDIRANVETALTQDQRQLSVLAELAKFDPVLFRQETLYDLLTKASEQLLRTPRSRTRSESPEKWLRRWAKRHFGPDAHTLDSAMTVERMSATFGDKALALAVGKEYAPRSYDGVPLEHLSALVEAKRKRIKSLWRNLEVYPAIIRALAAYKSNSVSTDLTAREFVLDRLQSTRNQRQWKMLVPILADLGISVPPHSSNHAVTERSHDM